MFLLSCLSPKPFFYLFDLFWKPYYFGFHSCRHWHSQIQRSTFCTKPVWCHVKYKSWYYNRSFPRPSVRNTINRLSLHRVTNLSTTKTLDDSCSVAFCRLIRHLGPIIIAPHINGRGKIDKPPSKTYVHPIPIALIMRSRTDTNAADRLHFKRLV